MIRRTRRLLPFVALAALIAAAYVAAIAQDGTGGRERGGNQAGRRGRTGGRRNRSPLKVGQIAPDFDLALVAVNLPQPTARPATRPTSRPATRPTTRPADEKPPNVKLSQFRGKRPVVLIFSSYT